MISESIILYGAGDYGRKAYAYYKHTHRVVAFMDSDPAKAGQLLESITIHAPADLARLPYDRIFVASSHADEIVRDLNQTWGIAPDRLFVVPISTLHTQADARHLKNDFTALSALLNAHDLPYWLDHSSLLGFIRDGDPFQIDIDLTVFAEHAERLLALLSATYSGRDFTTYRYGFDGAYWHQDDIRQFKLFGGLDIHVKVQSDRTAYWLVGPMVLHADMRHYDGVEHARCANTILNLPHDPRAYLQALYGNWETPASDWTYADYNNIESVMTRHEMQRGAS